MISNEIIENKLNESIANVEAGWTIQVKTTKKGIIFINSMKNGKYRHTLATIKNNQLSICSAGKTWTEFVEKIQAILKK